MIKNAWNRKFDVIATSTAEVITIDGTFYHMYPLCGTAHHQYKVCSRGNKSCGTMQVDEESGKGRILCEKLSHTVGTAGFLRVRLMDIPFARFCYWDLCLLRVGNTPCGSLFAKRWVG